MEPVKTLDWSTSLTETKDLLGPWRIGSNPYRVEQPFLRSSRLQGPGRKVRTTRRRTVRVRFRPNLAAPAHLQTPPGAESLSVRE